MFSAEGWTKSFRSQPNGNQCVEWNDAGSAVGLRDSNHPDGPVLAMDATQWAAFQDAVLSRTVNQ
ncbi:DUF397 domain-containing protein [Actinopolyspora erythraea]|uniref:DUF397 domain-containing protein n=1 Tax=Actinopolyspora erythraea TaxID=414996 RepID=UPI001C11EC94|nr:DUF397 domain-containing protein [Actinopolyspora erythraea]